MRVDQSDRSRLPAPSGLLGRRLECEMLDDIVGAIRAGESRSIVIQGDAGIGKTALLEYLRQAAAGCRVASIAGVESEMELAFAAVHQLCSPMLDRLERLPEPQRDALGTALGLRPGPAPDRFLVGLAVLSLLAETAEEQPLLCVIDDAQWLDRASAQAFALAARRLSAEAVAIVFAVRAPSADVELSGLPELAVVGLAKSDAQALLNSVAPLLLEANVSDRILAETHGNPLAILELARALSPAELASGIVLPVADRLADQIENSFARRVALLPADTQRLLLIAAAEPFADAPLVWRAAAGLGIGIEASAPASAAGLLTSGSEVRFRHPLVRSAVYHSASAEDRRIVHSALAGATDPEVSLDRHTWHRAQAATGPSEELAEQLELSADAAQARGGFAQAVVFLQQSTLMTPDPMLRTRRALYAARVATLAGDFEAAQTSLVAALAGPIDELGRSHAALVNAQIAFTMNRGSDAAPLLLGAAERLAAVDAELSRETYLHAFSAAMFADRPSTGVGPQAVAEAVRAAPRLRKQPSRPADLLLNSLALRFTEGYAVGAPQMRRALLAFRSERGPDASGARALQLACVSAADLWDDESWEVLSARYLENVRDARALAELPTALNTRIYMDVFAGDLRRAAVLVEEAAAATDAMGIRPGPFGALALLAWQGREAQVRELMKAEVFSRAESFGTGLSDWANALLGNGLGHYDRALIAAEKATAHHGRVPSPAWSLVELIEASARSGRPDAGFAALRSLTELTQASGTDWALGLEARSRALLSDGDEAERLYGEAVERLQRTRIRTELARAQLVYGEWLRRERRRLDAREQLHAAHESFLDMGTDAFADRAARELRATGATARRRSVETAGDLTAQETQIARLAREGLSNPEIAGRLFLSPRTVEYHLRKVFAKLQIKSRTELDAALPR